MPDIATCAVERKPCSQGYVAPCDTTPDGLPPGLDPARHPIIATHFYGWRPVGEIVAEVVMRLRPPREMPNHPPLTYEVPEFID